MLGRYQLTAQQDPTANSLRGCSMPPMYSDDRFTRSLPADLHTALDLIVEFKKALDKLHPDVTQIVEGWLQTATHNRY